MAKIVALDSLVFIYVLNGDLDFGPHARGVLQSAELGAIRLVASELVQLEVLSSSKLHDDDIAKIQVLLTGTGVDYQPIDMSVLHRAAGLRRMYPALKAPDAIHLATALESGADQFVTNDHQLLKTKVDGVDVVALAEYAVRRLL